VTSRWWLRPKWVAGHVLCLVLIVLFVNLGFWQLRRLDEKRDRNDRIHARERAAPTAVVDALAGGIDDAEYRRVRQTGTWGAAETVLVRNRSLDSRPGYDVLSPLLLPDGTGIVVNRGFTPAGGGGEDAILDFVRPKDGQRVTVEGILRTSERRKFGPSDPPTGHLRVLNRIDVERLTKQLPMDVPTAYLQLTSSRPPPGRYPEILPLPATDEGPHLSYAVQWFIFATIGAIGWPLLLRKTARDLADGRETDEAEETATTG